MDEYFVDWLKTEIKRKHKSVREFAMTAGIGVVHMYHIVHGIQYPSPHTLSLIFKALGTSLTEQKKVVWLIWCEKSIMDSRHRF